MVFLDFDGTLVSVWERYFQVFSNASGITGITQEQYRQAKRRLRKDDEVAEEFHYLLPPDYYETKRVLLETLCYLKLDTLLLPAAELIAFFLERDCRILTNRRNPETFRKQLSYLGLECLWEKSIVLHPEKEYSKKAYIQRNYPNTSNIVVGDSRAEWEAASLDNTGVFLVRTGLHIPEDFPHLPQCNVLDDITDFLKIMDTEENRWL